MVIVSTPQALAPGVFSPENPLLPFTITPLDTYHPLPPGLRQSWNGERTLYQRVKDQQETKLKNINSGYKARKLSEFPLFILGRTISGTAHPGSLAVTTCSGYLGETP